MAVSRRLRDWADARTLSRAERIFYRRQWNDVPGYAPTVATTVAHLRYRAKTLRTGREVMPDAS
jgi:hypothetical protein